MNVLIVNQRKGSVRIVSRKKTELNPKRAERVKIIIDREKISQIEFAHRIHQSQQNVSRIVTLKSALTEDNAQAIVNAFPEYRLQWLLGYDDFMTQTDQLRSLIHNKVDTAEALNQVIRLVADDICSRENIPRPYISFIPDFSQLQTMLHDYAELIISDYLKNRDHSRIWNRIDSQFGKK